MLNKKYTLGYNSMDAGLQGNYMTIIGNNI